MTSKQRSRSFILVPIDFSYTTYYRLSIVTFALGRTVYSHNTFRTDRQTTDRRRQTQHWLKIIEVINKKTILCGATVSSDCLLPTLHSSWLSVIRGVQSVNPTRKYAEKYDVLLFWDTVYIIMWPTLRGCIKCCTPSVCPFLPRDAL